MRRLLSAFSLCAVLLLGGCGYNTLQVTDETIKSSWSEVVNQYQRRADLVPNLVATTFPAKTSAAAEPTAPVVVTADESDAAPGE